MLRKKLEQQIKILQNIVDVEDRINEDTKDEYIRTKNKLEEMYVKDSKGASIRARVKWIEEGERNTKYCMGLEKKNGEKKNIVRLRKDRKFIEKQDEIQNERERERK